MTSVQFGGPVHFCGANCSIHSKNASPAFGGGGPTGADSSSLVRQILGPVLPNRQVTRSPDGDTFERSLGL